MLNLSSRFRDYVHDVREYSRLVQREKLLIDPTSIVLLSDFMMKCAEPQARIPSSLGKFFQNYNHAICDYVEGWTVEKSIPVFPLTFEQLTPARQHLARKAFDPSLYAAQVSEVDLIIQQLRAHIPDVVVYIDYRQNLNDNRPENREYPAVYVSSILEAVNNCHISGNALETYEARTILQGYGADVLHFWQSVRTLKDYSGFFPDKKKAKGNRPDKDLKSLWAGVWVPAFG